MKRVCIYGGLCACKIYIKYIFQYSLHFSILGIIPWKKAIFHTRVFSRNC